MADFAIGRTFNSPANNLRGMCWDGNNFWIVCLPSDGPIIYETQIDGTTLSSFSAPDDWPWGITWDGNHLWNVDFGSDMLYELQTDGTVVSSAKLWLWEPLGICWDGTYFWYIDNMGGGNHRARQVDDGGNEQNYWDFPDSENYEAIEYYNGYLWTTEPGIYTLKKRTPSSGNVQSTRTYPNTIGQPSAIVRVGAHWWVADRDDDVIKELVPPEGDYIAMSIDKTGTTWYAWLSGSDLIVNRLATEDPTSQTAMTVDSSGDYDAVADVQHTGSFIRVIVRKASDKKPYAFQSTDFGSSWSGPTDIS